MKRFVFCLMLLASSARLWAAPATQPVYIYLYARITDHVNLDVTEDRIRRVLPMIEHYRADHPQAHVSATILFSGAVSQALDQRNPTTGIKDLVLAYKKRGIIEVGYDGTDEPTYQNRPLADLSNTQTPQARWQIRSTASEKFLTQARDPLTGELKPGILGGLAEMQHVFGEAACITGVSVGDLNRQAVLTPRQPGVGDTPNVTPEIGDWEVVPLLRRFNTQAILFGIPAANPANVPGFNGSVMGIGQLMSPVPDSSPELYWADNVLRSSESGGPAVRAVRAYEGATALQDITTKMDRSRIRILHVELASEKDYLQPDFAKASRSPSLSYAYTHPNTPQLPPDARRQPDQVNAAYATEAALLTWLTSDFFPANPNSRFVSSSDLRRMATRSTGYAISTAALRAALTDTLTQWGNDTYPPAYLFADGHYLSLAEWFQVATDALASFHRTGSLPASVQVASVYGPIGMVGGHGPNIGDVSIASIARQCADLQPGLHDTSIHDHLPTNVIPSFVRIDGIPINAAQFLRLMSQALVNPIPDNKLRVRMTYMTSATASIFPKTRSLEDAGATWTFKPALLDTNLPTTQAAESRR